MCYNTAGSIDGPLVAVVEALGQWLRLGAKMRHSSTLTRDIARSTLQAWWRSPRPYSSSLGKGIAELILVARARTSPVVRFRFLVCVRWTFYTDRSPFFSVHHL